MYFENREPNYDKFPTLKIEGYAGESCKGMDAVVHELGSRVSGDKTIIVLDYYHGVHKEVVGIHAFTLIKESDVTAICRNFAPLYGIDEESATGTASCALTCYLFKYYKQQSQYIFEQGYNMGKFHESL